MTLPTAQSSASGEFIAIAERELQLRGPSERTVRVRLGHPERDPEHAHDFRCPFQVTGLSDDSVKFAHGVDSFQALNLAFVGIRSFIAQNASVLAAFHTDFSLTWEGLSWELALPVWVPLHDAAQLRRAEHFLKEELWDKTSVSGRVDVACVQPVLAVRDVRAALEFYQRLGFQLKFRDDDVEPRYAGVRRGGVELHLQWHAADEWDHPADRPNYRFVVQEVDRLFEEFQAHAHLLDQTPVSDTAWGTREFHVRDPDGNGLQFYRALTPAPQ